MFIKYRTWGCSLALFLVSLFGEATGLAYGQDELDVQVSETSTVDELPPEPKPSPTPLNEDELAEWEVQNKIPLSRRKKIAGWPGTFIAPRISYLIGASLIPKLGIGNELGESQALDFHATHFGLDVGHTPKYSKWGGGAIFEISAGMPKPSYLKSAPLHWLATLYANYVPSRYIRWILGWNVLSQTEVQYFGGQIARMQGFGFRAGVHLRSTKYSLKPFEWFTHLGWVQITNISAGFANNQANYDPRKFLGPNATTYNAWVMTGIQYSFQAEEKSDKDILLNP